jgi:hypothetical protein
VMVASRPKVSFWPVPEIIDRLLCTIIRIFIFCENNMFFVFSREDEHTIWEAELTVICWKCMKSLEQQGQLKLKWFWFSIRQTDSVQQHREHVRARGSCVAACQRRLPLSLSLLLCKEVANIQWTRFDFDLFH